MAKLLWGILLEANNIEEGVKAGKVEEVLERVKGMKNILDLRVLPDELRGEVARLEEEAGKEIFMGLATSENRGVKEVLARGVVVIVLEGPTCELVRGQQTIYLTNKGLKAGEQVVDAQEVERLRKDPNAMFISDDFVLYTNVLPTGENMTEKINKKEFLCVFPPLSIPDLERAPGIKDPVVGWPAPPVDVYLKKQFPDLDKKGNPCGTFLLGFNLV